MRTFGKAMFATGCMALGGIGAHAADLPVRAAPPPYVAPVPVFTWTGAYFGVNAGASFDDETKYRLTGITAIDNGIASGNRPGAFKTTDSGFTAGGQIGYNYQLGGFAGGGVVIGFDADAAYIDSAKTVNYVGNPNTTPSLNTFRSGIDFLGTARGRLGYAFNQFLIYGTGGFAYGDTFQKVSFYSPNNAAQLRYFGSQGGLQTGYTYGGGVEYALPTGSFLNFFHSSAVTLKAEYLRYDLGGSSFTQHNLITNTATSGYVINTRTEGNIARVGLNYKF